MVVISKRLSLIIFFVAGFIFIGIGIASIIDSNIPRFVEITETIKPNQSGIFTPDMNSGNIANIYANGSESTVLVIDPNNKLIMNKTTNIGALNETVTSEVNGKYKIQVINEGEDTLNLNLGAFSKASPLAFSGQMMLIITGIVVVGLGIRTRMQS
jgi:hypothetical protein